MAIVRETANPSAANTLDPNRDLPPGEFDAANAADYKWHPPGLFLLFFVEMWERFSYYGMRALLVLYLMENATAGHLRQGVVNPGRGWGEDSANALYGVYTGLAYLLPIAGGFIADKLLGTHRSMVLGGIMIALGHIALALSGLGDLAFNAAGLSIFIFGLATIIIGTGYFKPCVSTMVGQLYRPGDPKRDGGFSIFYMGINLGAFLCAFVCGTLGEKVGWHWGFGAAAVGMVLGLITYFIGRPVFLKGIGLPPPGKTVLQGVWLFGASLLLAAFVGYLHYAGFFAWMGSQYEKLAAISVIHGETLDKPALSAAGLGWLSIVGILVVMSLIFIMKQPRGDRGPVASIFVFMIFNIFFWMAFEQAGSTLNTFADKSTDLTVPFTQWKMPATWFQSFNAAFIILLAPVFTWLWGALGRYNPSQPVKIGLGLLFVGLGYIPMVFAAHTAATGVLVGLGWLSSLYFIHTLGELCLSPTGLSYVTKAAPPRYMALLMGIWFISSFAANLGGGLIASQVEKIEKGEIKPFTTAIAEFGGRADYFFMFVVICIGAGAVILLLSPLLKKLMRNPND